MIRNLQHLFFSSYEQFVVFKSLRKYKKNEEEASDTATKRALNIQYNAQYTAKRFIIKQFIYCLCKNKNRQNKLKNNESIDHYNSFEKKKEKRSHTN